MPLYYILLFPYSDPSQYQGMQPYSNSYIYQYNYLPQQAYFQFYLYIYNTSKLVPFAFQRLFQQYIINTQALYNQNKLNWIYFYQSNLYTDLYNGIMDAISYRDVNPNSISRCIILPLNYLSSYRFISQCYQNSIVIVRYYSRLSLFITFIANPQ